MLPFANDNPSGSAGVMDHVATIPPAFEMETVPTSVPTVKVCESMEREAWGSFTVMLKVVLVEPPVLFPKTV